MSRKFNLINQKCLISTFNIFTFAGCDENIAKSGFIQDVFGKAAVHIC